MIVREANDHERRLLLRGDEGFVAEEGETIVGHVGFNDREGGFYAHSMYCPSGGATAASLIQRARRECRGRGYGRILFVVGAGYPALARLVSTGRASVVSRHERGLLLAMEV